MIAFSGWNNIEQIMTGYDVANSAMVGGDSPTDLATQWLADNRDLVDEWIAAARAAGSR